MSDSGKTFLTSKYNISFASQPNQKQLSDWLDNCCSGEWRINPATGKIDVLGDFISVGLFNYIPGPGFGTIKGDFGCQYSCLNSLIGCPQDIGGSFFCYQNSLTSLAGGPAFVGGDYLCSSNPLESLEGAPEKLGGTFDCTFFALRDWNSGGKAKTYFRRAIPFFDEQGPDLLFPIISLQEIADHLVESPLDIDLLEPFPEIKSKVLAMTGLQDFTDLARAHRMGIV
jgi:hypothetical protein